MEAWSRERRVIGKVEATSGKANPRFVVTSLTPAKAKPQQLYEKTCRLRGETENRSKGCSATWSAPARGGSMRAARPNTMRHPFPRSLVDLAGRRSPPSRVSSKDAFDHGSELSGRGTLNTIMK